MLLSRQDRPDGRPGVRLDHPGEVAHSPLPGEQTEAATSSEREESLTSEGVHRLPVQARLRASFQRWSIAAAVTVVISVGWNVYSRATARPHPRDLYRAAETGDVPEVLSLLDRLGGSGGYANAALARATEKGRRAVVEAVLPRTGREGRSRAVLAAVRARRPDLIAPIAAAGVDLELRDPEGRTLLMKAALQGEREIVVALLSAGADPSRKDFDGKTGRDLALAAREWQIARMLHEAMRKSPRSPRN